jgi:hypothetical protein
MAQDVGANQEDGRYRFQYAAKVLCTADITGTSQTSPSVLPGVYETAVNIHNPHDRTVKLRKKIALSSGEVSKFVDQRLEADQATSVNCAGITSDFGITFIHGAEGFLVVESTHSLDVVAVYTAGQRGGEVTSIDVEQVKERELDRE